MILDKLNKTSKKVKRYRAGLARLRRPRQGLGSRPVRHGLGLRRGSLGVLPVMLRDSGLRQTARLPRLRLPHGQGREKEGHAGASSDGIIE